MAISEFPVARCNDLARRHSFGSLRCRQWESVRDVAAARNRTIFPSNSLARIAVPMYVFPGGASFCGLSCYDAIKCDCAQLRWYYDAETEYWRAAKQTGRRATAGREKNEEAYKNGSRDQAKWQRHCLYNRKVKGVNTLRIVNLPNIRDPLNPNHLIYCG